MKKISTLMALLVLLGGSAFAQCITDWTYITPVMVYNSNSDTLTNHQVMLTVNTAALVTAGKMDSTGADIRFTEGNCCSLLCYAIDSNMNSASTQIWVNVPQVLPNDSVEIWMAYGNSAAAEGQDWACTFDFWEPFDTSVHQFSNSCGNVTSSVSAGELNLSWSSNGIMIASSTFPSSSVYTAEMNVTAATGNWPGVYWNNTSNYKGYSLLLGSNLIRIGVATTSASNYCRAENWASSTFSYTGVTGVWKSTWVATGDQRAYFPGYGNLSATNTLHAKDVEQALCIGGISSGTGSMNIDWIRVRKWANIEPTSSVGSEMLLGATAVNLNDANVCDGSTIMLDAGAGFVSYSWSTGDTSAMIPVDTSGTFTVSVLDNMGCPSTDSATVTLVPAPNVNIGADTSLCPGEMLTLDAGNGFVMYTWSNGDSTSTSTVSTAGTYSVMVTDSNGCSASDSMTLGALIAPTAAFTATPGSTGFDVTFADGSTNGSTYSWDFGDGNTSTDQNPTHTYGTDGSYVVCLTVTSTDGCTDTSCDTVVVTGVGIDQGLSGASVTLFPNPVQNELFVSFEQGISGHVDLQVVDMMGAVIRKSGHEVAAGDRLRLDMNDLAAGVYFLRIRTDEGSLSRRFVVK